MKDLRYEKLAETLIDYSLDLKKGDKIILEVYDVPLDMTRALVRKIHQVGGVPAVWLKDYRLMRELQMGGTEAQWRFIADAEGKQMEAADCYIGIRGGNNISELSDVPHSKQTIYEQILHREVHLKTRIEKTRWCVLRWPTQGLAQQAKRSTEGFEDFFFNVMGLDYSKMSRAMLPLKERMEGCDRVHIQGPGETDLTFSIRGIPAVPCDGKINMPDGEVFTAPVRDSINGVIQYNTPSLYRGTVHENIRFEFKNGKIVKGTSSQTAKLNEVLDTDEGARYVGEFAIGFNPNILEPMNDILFDEKIAGSLHLTPGKCYDVAPNGNNSDIHWDIVLIQRPEYGGGEIWFDEVLIRKDGLFVVPDLEGLNPKALLG